MREALEVLTGAFPILIWTNGIVLGAVAAILSAIRLTKVGEYAGSRPWELVALAVSIFCALGAVMIAVGSIQHGNHVVLALATAQLLSAIASIVVFSGRRRRLVEGLSSITLGIFVFLTGFSIGLFVLPFSTLLGAVAVYHARIPDAKAPARASG